jgi:7-cyano-7-deazaguanine synthase in queuosine biosynthesis
MTTGARAFDQHFGPPTSLEADLLTVASSIYCADLAVKRGEREKIARKIRLTIPVVHVAAFQAMRDQIVFVLYTLSHDAWDIRFVQRPGVPETPQAWPVIHDGKVLLFSGGLDALSGAIRLGDSGERVLLVSHATGNPAVSAAQKELTEYIERQYPNQFTRFPFRVGGRNQMARGFPFPTDEEREETQRTRSFLFLALAALVARRKGVTNVVIVAENGQMALNLPLSAARISAFSTHTAHPSFLTEMAPLLTSLLQHTIRIENPFLFETKAEVVAQTVRNHAPAVRRSISCWKASRIAGGLRHCGFCVPCMIRRIAVEFNGLRLPEYKRDLFRENIAALAPEDDGKRNIVDLAEFVHVFGSGRSQAQLEETYPDLASPYFSALTATSMYRRFAAEAISVFGSYPTVAPLLM